MAAPRVLVTRPVHDGAPWVAALRAQGIAAHALPLLEIAPITDPALAQRLEQARTHWASYAAVMFVSGNAVQHFFEPNQAQTLIQQAQAAINTRVWAPGPGTLAALRGAGLAAARIDGPAPGAAQYDSEALWQQVAAQIGPGARVLIVRGTCEPARTGGQGRDWLAAQLAGAGARVDFVAAYRRSAPRWSAAQQHLARAAAADGSLWLLSSREALAHLRALLPHQPWQGAAALATHPRIAAAAHAAGFGRVHESRPTLDDVAASIKSLA